LRYVSFDPIFEYSTATTSSPVSKRRAASGDYATRLRLPKYRDASVIIDPRFGWGAPVLEQNRVPVSAVIDLYTAGESMEAVADEYGLTVEDVEAICRGALSAA
jgi:uncharacterized protein (DUF433 family)